MTRSRRKNRNRTVEEFDAWAAANKSFDETAETADEGGGPRLSLVPLIDQEEAWPTDLLPVAGDSETPATPFDGVELPESRNRLAGWSAERQRYFLSTLAETGSVHLAASATRLIARGAYKET